MTTDIDVLREGFRFPAEWEPQEAVWFAWPIRRDLWSGRLDAVRQQLAALYVTAARFQAVRVLCPLSAQADLRSRMAMVGDASGVTLFDYETDDVWIRDYGPLFLLSADGGELAVADWRFNAWGAKFPKYRQDDAASAWIADHLGLRRWYTNYILEGGAVESNGAGGLLTTEDVLLNSNRNLPTDTEAVESLLAGGLAVDHVLWLKEGLVGDDTDGHIDNLARFFKADGILLASSDPSNPNFSRLEENATLLAALRTPADQPYEVRRLPLPDPIYDEGDILAASYMNFTLVNGGVLVPTYGQPERDAEALACIGECFPGREVVGVDCRDIIHEGGALHCMSQHQPARVPHGP